MMHQCVVICALAALKFVAGAETETVLATTCVGRFTIAGETCEAISAFAHCLALTAPSDEFRQGAEKALANAQTTTPGCDLRVNPSISIVNREVRLFDASEFFMFSC